MSKKDINAKFDEKIKELEDKLPKLKDANCSELTLTSVLDILGVDNYLFHNLAIPLAGGFGGYKSAKEWQGACGAVSGGCAAIGVIMGGHEKMNSDMIPMAYLKAAKYATEFEKKFSSVVCRELCSCDFSAPNGYIEYSKNKIWGKKCYKYVVWAVDEVRKLTKRDLKKNWE